MEIFKKYDIRGLYPSELNEDNAFRIGRALATAVRGKNIFVNYDNRLGSIRIKESFTRGLLRSGATVYELGMGPVMVTAFASIKENACGVCLSASHNPKDYAGVLTYIDGVTLTPERIEKVYASNRFKERFGKPIPFAYDKEYIDYITKGTAKLGLKVGVDSMGGATTYITPFAFERIGMKTSMLWSSPSENFYGKTPEPSIENAKALGKLVRKEKLDFGVQLDADGDRGLVVDEKGNALDPMVTAMILIKYLKYKRIVATIASSSLLEKYAKVKYVKTGRPNVESELKKGGYDFGIETAAHTYFPHYYPFSDGILTGIMIGKVLKESGKKLSELVNEFPKVRFGNLSLELRSTDQVNKRMIRIRSKLNKYKKRIELDGIKVMLDDGFMLFRPSNTENGLIRGYYEGHSAASFRRIGKLAKEIMR